LYGTSTKFSSIKVPSKTNFQFFFNFEQNIAELLNQEQSDLEQKLCQIGDSIVYKLVQWTRRLPFFSQLSVNLTTRLLTHKWHELLVLTTSAYQAIHGTRRMGTTRTDGEKVELHQEVIYRDVKSKC
jgi:nuclear receptor subfamily 6 group A